MSKLRTNRQRWAFIGGHLALDLCNTRSWRLDPARSADLLGNGPELGDWFAASGGGTVRRVPTEVTLAAVRRLRDAAIRIVDAQLDHAPADPADIEHVATAWRRALAVAGTPTGLPWRWQIDPPGAIAAEAPADDREWLVHALALSVADLMHRPDPTLLRRCDGDGCGWLFLDTSRNHSRRWCDPQDCGNRARVRSYTERRRRAGTLEP